MPAPTDPVVVVSDAHLGHAPLETALAFHRFLHRVPDLGRHLVINGDLFDFWFEYRTVIPRTAFQVLADLLVVRRAGVRLTVTGGNHDRWGHDFWRSELDAEFHPDSVELDLVGWRALVAHGDGKSERRRAGRMLHALTRHPATIAAFRWIHPDIGIRLANTMSVMLADHTRDPAELDAAATAQATYADGVLERRADIDLLILGHTHRPIVRRIGEHRWYLNPGAWIEGLRYAVVTRDGPRLQTFESKT